MASANVWHKTATSVDIQLDNAVITYKTLTRILLSIIEFLSYNRNQIPFVYETFNHMVNGLVNKSQQQCTSELSMTNIALERQRESAVNIRGKFQEISKILIKSLKSYEIEQALVIFGATISTAKEAFVINLPPRSLCHSVQNHLDSLQAITRQVIMAIISSTAYFDVNCNELKPTNMYVVLKSKHNITDDCFHRYDGFRLPSMCRTTLLNVENHLDEMSLKCCQNLVIFDDTEELENTTDSTTKTIAESINAETENFNRTNSDAEKSTTSNDLKFYECNIIVKGFKNQLVKGQSIWTN